LDGLSASVSKALGVAVRFHDTASADFALVGGWVMPGSKGQAVQLVFRDTKDNKLITMYLEGRPGAKETPFRRVAGAGVPTVAWEDDDLTSFVTVLMLTPVVRVVKFLGVSSLAEYVRMHKRARPAHG
jgi:anti-sigma factor RsiW